MLTYLCLSAVAQMLQGQNTEDAQELALGIRRKCLLLFFTVDDEELCRRRLRTAV